MPPDTSSRLCGRQGLPYISKTDAKAFRYRELYHREVIMDVALCYPEGPRPGRKQWSSFPRVLDHYIENSYMRLGSDNYTEWAFVMLLMNVDKISYIGSNDDSHNWDPFWLLMDCLSRRYPTE